MDHRGMARDRIDLNLLPILDAILRTQSVSKAATAVGLSKAAASHALARIRTQADDPILVRAGQKWILSERAVELAPRVRAALTAATSVLAPERAFDPRSLHREFRIHASDQMLSLLGLELGHTVTDQAPNVALRFLPLDADEATPLRDNVDLALGVFDAQPPELLTQKLFDDRYSCVARAAHATVRGKLTLEQFLTLRHVVIAARDRSRSVVEESLAKRKLVRRAVRWVPFYSTALELVAESDCIATVSERLAMRHAARFELQVLPVPLVLPPCAGAQLWHPRLDAEPAHRWLRNLVASVARRTTGTSRMLRA
jgi:DNA-binding transcriptional LysR family regulator